ncbi:MAG: hypothetical protein ACTSRG_01945 [Candidatus Helarchaeota archaeon]
MVITKQDFEIYVDLMMDLLDARREQLRVSAFKMFSDGSTEYFEDAIIISILESGIIVEESGYEEDEEEYYEQEVEEEKEIIFVPWTSIDEITITKK